VRPAAPRALPLRALDPLERLRLPELFARVRDELPPEDFARLRDVLLPEDVARVRVELLRLPLADLRLPEDVFLAPDELRPPRAAAAVRPAAPRVRPDVEVLRSRRAPGVADSCAIGIVSPGASVSSSRIVVAPACSSNIGRSSASPP
jgi:hypothetical protein